MAEIKELSIRGEFIRLDAAMKPAGLCATGGHAKLMIQNDEVTVNGDTCTARGRKLRLGDSAKTAGGALIIKHADQAP